MAMAHVKILLRFILFTRIGGRFQQFPLKYCFPKLLYHISAFVSAIYRKEVCGMILKKNLLKSNKMKDDYLCSPALGVRIVIHTFHSLFVIVT